MASAAACRLARVAVRPGPLWSGPRGTRGGDVPAAPGSSGRSLVPARSVIVTRSGAILPKPVKVSVRLEAGQRDRGQSLGGNEWSLLIDRRTGQSQYWHGLGRGPQTQLCAVGLRTLTGGGKMLSWVPGHTLEGSSGTCTVLSRGVQ